MRIWRKKQRLFRQLPTKTIIASKFCNIKDKAGNIPNVVYMFSACHKYVMAEVGIRDFIRHAV